MREQKTFTISLARVQANSQKLPLKSLELFTLWNEYRTFLRHLHFVISDERIRQRIQSEGKWTKQWCFLMTNLNASDWSLDS